MLVTQSSSSVFNWWQKKVFVEICLNNILAVDTMKYKLPYKALFGGVVALKRQHFEDVNGFSNQFWGWGGEDDDMFNRVKHAGMNITRYSADIAR